MLKVIIRQARWCLLVIPTLLLWQEDPEFNPSLGRETLPPGRKKRRDGGRKRDGDGARGREKGKERDSFILNFSRIPKEQQYKWKMRTDLN
jgi:hypothetical protein